jgi:hypothetical protein
LLSLLRPRDCAGIGGTVRRWRYAAIVLIVASCGGADALAATAVSPVDGATVGSRPTFGFDLQEGDATVELSKSPDLLVSGTSAGAFVDVAAKHSGTVGGAGRPAGVLPWRGSPSRLLAGRYFWHAQIDNYDGVREPGEGAWSPTRVLTVRDEPPEVEGWTLTVTRLKPQGFCDRVRVAGVLRVSDNAQPQLVRLTVVLDIGSGVMLDAPGAMIDAQVAADTYERTFCTRASRLAVFLEVDDPSGQTTRTESRAVTIAAAKHRSPTQIVRDEFRDYKAALKAGDGKRACELMDTAYRASFRISADPYRFWDSCVELVETRGPSIYREARLSRLGIKNVRVRGRYAAGCLTPRYSGAEFFVRSATGWQLHFPSPITARQFRRICG